MEAKSFGSGKLITVEGLDGAGKTSAIKAIVSNLDTKPLLLHEPGGTWLSDLMRAILKGEDISRFNQQKNIAPISPLAKTLLLQAEKLSSNKSLKKLIDDVLYENTLEQPNEDLSDMDELLLFNVARAQLMKEIILPALEEDKIIIIDRFIDSTVAYQGYGRGLDVDLVREECLKATGGIIPDKTFYLKISPETRHARMKNRGGPDRIESSGDKFFNKVAAGFDAMADEERFEVIDAERSPKEVRAEIRERFNDFLLIA